MAFDYFTPGDAEQYAFYRVPKLLITGEQFRTLSMEAELLYGILLDRVSLSLRHGWVDARTNYAKEISNLIREAYGGKIKVYKTDIPRSIRAAEISAEGKSIFEHDPKEKVADAYKVLTKEVLHNAEKRLKRQSPEL